MSIVSCLIFTIPASPAPPDPIYSSLCRLIGGFASKIVKRCGKGDQIWTHFTKVDRFLARHGITEGREQTRLGAYIVNILMRNVAKKAAAAKNAAAAVANNRRPSLEFFGYVLSWFEVFEPNSSPEILDQDFWSLVTGFVFHH